MLIVDKTNTVIDTEDVKRGSLIYAKHMSWDEGVSGIVTEANEKFIRLQFLPKIANVINHTIIKASDVAKGYWLVRYSSDGMETVKEYAPPETAEGGEEHGSE